MGEIVRFKREFTQAEVENAGVGRIPVLIPAHNSEKRISNVISNLGSQKLPDGAYLDIYVCANACKDRTPEVAERALEILRSNNPDYDTHLIVVERPGQAQALNTMMEAAGRPKWVIEQQDDSFAQTEAVGYLAIAASLNPKLGVIGVENDPLPTHRGKKGTLIERCLYGLYSVDNPSVDGVVDRLCAFRPDIVGEFPDLVSVDNHMVLQSSLNSNGIGLVDGNVTRVFFRLPTSTLDMFRQQDMYVRGTQQMIRDYPQFKNILYTDTIISSGWRNKINKILNDNTLSFQEKLVIIGLKVYAKTISRLVDKISPYTNSNRSRIWSSV